MYVLYFENRRLGVLSAIETDFPWVCAQFTPNAAGLAVARDLYSITDTDEPPDENGEGSYWEKPWFLASALDEVTRIWTPAFHRDGTVNWRIHTRPEMSPKRPLLRTLSRLLQRRIAATTTHWPEACGG